MSVELPDVYHVDVDEVAPITVTPITVASVGAVGPVTIDGIPSEYHIHVDTLDKIEVGVDPLTVTLTPIEIRPLEINARLKEIPSVRAHLPANYALGLSLFGMELAKVRLCGEAQIITEPYRPNPCEVCGPSSQSQPPGTAPAGVLRLEEG
ncbi:MAG: hypothetical protein OES32_01260 [Acidobacteriota bacterium]|nr:hypothetical protein [Acidobacteriota bacterium]